MTEKIIEIPVEYKPLFDTNWREAAIWGGRYSLKSHTVARVLLIRARQKKIRIGCFREFQNSIAESSHQLLADLIKLYEFNDFVVTDNSIVNTLTKSDFLFKGLYRNEQSIKSIEGIDIAWVEEAQTITEKSIEVLTPTVRNEGSQIIYTYNRLLEDDPVHKRLVLEGRPNTLKINVNYDIAEKYGFLPEAIKAEIEDDKQRRPSLYKHKWLGEPVNQEDKIYKDWAIIEEIPHEARLMMRGLDFGYSNNPTAIVDVFEYNGGYILHEQLYRKGMSNKQIADFILSLENPNVLVMADSAEPKSIDEINSFGITILPAPKGPDSIRQGVQFVQDQKISVTQNSLNLLKEYRNYMWAKDKDGRKINVPEDIYNHCFSGDTLVYTTEGNIRIDELIGKEGLVFSRGGRIERFFNVRQTRGECETLTLLFDDGNKITVTPEHLLLNTKGEWIEARLLNTMDSIQGVMYEHNPNISLKNIHKIQLRKISEQVKQKITQSCLAILQWRYWKVNAHTPHGLKPIKQGYIKSWYKNSTRTPFRTYDTRKKRKGEEMGRQNKTINKGVAFFGRMKEMAQTTLNRYLQKTYTCFKGVQPLPQNISDYPISKECEILFKQLQNESKAKKITRITRGRTDKVYNLEVENTHCFCANGIIAHNCMDSLRYAFSSKIKKQDFNYKEFEQNELQQAKNMYNTFE